MAIYAVHSSALDGDPAAAFDRAKVLRLGFARWAFVFGPLWLLTHRLWLAFGVWVLGAAIVGFAISGGILAPGAGPALYVLSAFALGIEGRALQGAALTHRGLPLADIVSANDREGAERGFLTRALAESSGRLASRGGRAPSQDGPSIIGLFPEAGR